MSQKRRTTAGNLRHRLLLQDELRTADDMGGYERGWSDVAQLWAEIVPISGKERLIAGQLHAEISHRIRIRYRTGVHAGMRLLYGERAFYIQTALNIYEKGDILELWVNER
jgi:SPP1 family predicted phage head-tail adaptor